MMKKIFNIRNRVRVLLSISLVIICLLGGIVAVFADNAPKGGSYSIVRTKYTRDSLAYSPTKSSAGIYSSSIASGNTVYARMVRTNGTAVSSTVVLNNTRTFASSTYYTNTTGINMFMSAKLTQDSKSGEMLFSYYVTP